MLLLCLIDSSTLAWNAAELSCINARKLVPDGKNNRSVSWKDYFIFSDLQPGKIRVCVCVCVCVCDRLGYMHLS